MGGQFYFPSAYWLMPSPVITSTDPAIPAIRIRWPDPTYLPPGAARFYYQFTAAQRSGHQPVPLSEIAGLQPRVCAEEVEMASCTTAVVELKPNVEEKVGSVCEDNQAIVSRVVCALRQNEKEESVAAVTLSRAEVRAARIKNRSARLTPPPLPRIIVAPPALVRPATKAMEASVVQGPDEFTTPPLAPPMDSVDLAPAIAASAAPPAPPLSSATSRRTGLEMNATQPRPRPAASHPLSLMEQIQQQQRMRAARVASAAVTTLPTPVKPGEEAKQPSPLPPPRHAALPPPLPLTWSLASSRRRAGVVQSIGAMLEEKVAVE